MSANVLTGPPRGLWVPEVNNNNNLLSSLSHFLTDHKGLFYHTKYPDCQVFIPSTWSLVCEINKTAEQGSFLKHCIESTSYANVEVFNSNST